MKLKTYTRNGIGFFYMKLFDEYKIGFIKILYNLILK